MTQGSVQSRTKPNPPARSNRTRQGRRRHTWLLPLIGLAALGLAAAVFVVAGRGGGAGDGAIGRLTTADFHALAFSPEDPNVAFFGHHNGLMRTADGGRTWRPLVDRRNFDAMSLALNPNNPRRVYLAGHDVFQVSADGGATWQPVSHNLPGTDIHAFAMSSNDPSRLYASVVGYGVFRSVDGAATWERLPGQPPGDLTSLAVGGGEPETLYAVSVASGVLRSEDAGQSWTASGQGQRPSQALTVAVDPHNRETLYVGGQSGIYRSSDAGSNWTRLPYPGDNAIALAISPVAPATVLAVSVKGREGLVFRSEDGGLTWGGPT